MYETPKCLMRYHSAAYLAFSVCLPITVCCSPVTVHCSFIPHPSSFAILPLRDQVETAIIYSIMHFPIGRLQWYALMLIAALVGGAWVYVTRVPDEDTRVAAEAAHINLRAPAFALDALGGSRVSSDALRGKVILVNFWASWCVPCRSEMPAIQAAFEAHRNDSFAVIAVNAGEDDSTAAQFVDEFHLTFPIALDRDQAVLRQYQVQALPTSFFVDPQGIIRATNVGGMSRAYIEAEIAALEPSP